MKNTVNDVLESLYAAEMDLEDAYRDCPNLVFKKKIKEFALDIVSDLITEAEGIVENEED